MLCLAVASAVSLFYSKNVRHAVTDVRITSYLGIAFASLEPSFLSESDYSVYFLWP